MKYAVVLHKDDGTAYGVTVPDVPGCFSAGDTVEEALDNAREAIYAHLELLAEDGEPVPDDVKIDMDKLASNQDFAGGIWAVVDVNIDNIAGPAERINLTVPRRALAKIDAAAKSLHDSRSALMTRATIEYIAGRATSEIRGVGEKVVALNTRGGDTRASVSTGQPRSYAGKVTAIRPSRKTAAGGVKHKKAPASTGKKK